MIDGMKNLKELLDALLCAEGHAETTEIFIRDEAGDSYKILAIDHVGHVCITVRKSV